MSKKRVLCYGDSNTWGYIPVEAKRYDLAGECGCAFIDIGAAIKAGDRDGIHLEEEQHRDIAEMTASWIVGAL